MALIKNVVTECCIVCDECGEAKIISYRDYCYPQFSKALKNWTSHIQARKTTWQERNHGAPDYVEEEVSMCPKCWRNGK